MSKSLYSINQKGAEESDDIICMVKGEVSIIFFDAPASNKLRNV